MVFAERTKATLEECGRWLLENAEGIAGEIAGGCKQWAIAFESGDEGMFPDVRVRVVTEKTALVSEEPYVWRDERRLVRDERLAYEGSKEDLGDLE